MDGTEKTEMDRENPYAATPPLRGHTYVSWVPGTCNATRRQIVWVTNKENATCGLKHYGKDRENPNDAQSRHWGHTNVPWVPVMWNGDSGRQTMEVTIQSNATTTLNDFGPGAAVLSPRGQEDISCREDRSVII